MRFYNIRYILCALCILFSCYHDGLAQTCDDVAVSISTTPVSCPDKNTGGVNIDVTGGEIVDFDWADGFIELEPQDLYAGSYELSLVIEISEGFTCTVPKMVVIGQPQVEVKLSVKDVSDCHETDGEILIDHLFEAEEINMNCSTMEIIEEYPTDGWIEISGYVAEDESYTISAGQQVVITEDCIFLGQLTIDGGTVVNKGYLRPSSININSFSEIRNYGSLNIMSDNEAQPNTLIIPTDIIFYNFGSLTIDIIELSGSLNNTNGDVLCNYLTLVTPDAIINNTGDIIVNNQLENNGFIVNDFEFQVDISFINNKSLNNACKLTCLNAFSNNGDVINNGSIEVLELTENNVAATIEIGPGSGLFSKHLENYGEIQGSGGECYVLAIHENSTHHPGSKIRGLYESAPTGGCLDDKVKDLVANFILPFGDRTGRSKVLSNLKYGWHDTEIEYTLASGQQCLINQEVFVDGGIAVYVNDPQTICAGEEIEIYGEINLDSPTPDEIHTYTWDTHGETIYNNDGFGTLLLKPENTVLVELTGEAQLAPGKTCTGTDDVIITVVPEIEILDNSGDEGQFTICSNETYQFNLSVSPEETEFIYSWSPEEGLSDPHILNPVVSRNSSADYILTVTNADNLKLFSIDVYNMKKEGLITQDEVITKLYNICNILYATEGEFEAAVTSQIGNVYMDMYKEVIKQHAAHGCSVQKEFQCTVLPAPKVSLNGIEGDIRLCGGGEKALEATVSDFDANDITWSWLPVTGLSDPAIPDPVAIVNNKISYTVTATSISNACKDEAVIDIDVYPNNLVVSIDEKACINLNPGEQQLVASGAKSYEWTPATGLSDPNIANPILYPGGLNEYTLNAIIEPEPGKECQVTEILSIDELNWPDAGADINYCIGSDQEISLSASGGRTGTYLWFPATGMGEGGEYSPDPVIQLKSSVTYTLQAENEFGCVNTDKVTVTVDPACRCFSNSGEGISYQWKGTESGDWGDPKNWYSVNPGGIPGNNISDNVIIEAAPNNCILDMDRKYQTSVSLKEA